MFDLFRQYKKLSIPSGLDSVFVNTKTKRQLSTNALLQKLNELAPDYTVHGFCSTFRDWVGEETSHPREVAESALAHTIKDRVEAAYRRGDFFQKRRQLMQEWSVYCNKATNAAFFSNTNLKFNC